jgi:tRNA(Ile)-lysidine synthase
VGIAAEGATVAIEVERLRELDPATVRRVLRAAARQIGVRVDFVDTTKLLGLVAAGTGVTGAKLQLSGGLRVERSARELRFFRPRSEPENS